MTTLPRRFVLSAVLTSAVAYSYEGTGPGGADLYLLYRVGSKTLPAPMYPSPDAPLYLADSLRLSGLRPRGQADLIITRTTLLRDPSGGLTRAVGQFRASQSADTLTIDTCPIDAFCAASLIYAPDVFQVVGDSLFEQLPPGSPRDPRVYGRARR